MTPDLWQTITLSLIIASRATLLALLIALPIAYLNARRRFRGKSFIEALIIVPMVLPPTVMGYLIILALGKRTFIGQILDHWFNFSIMFTLAGAILAAAIVALPLLYLPTRAAFAAIDRDIEDMARVEGANRLQVFWHISLPMAIRGVTSGVMLAFARALGEFGATVMVFGIRENRTTLPISIYIDYENGEMHKAFPAVLILCVLSLAIALLYNRSAVSRQS